MAESNHGLSHYSHNFHLCQYGILLLDDLLQHGHTTVGYLVGVVKGQEGKLGTWETIAQDLQAYIVTPPAEGLYSNQCQCY